jgi:hypothetical protein
MSFFVQIDVDGSNMIESSEIKRLLQLLAPAAEHTTAEFEDRVVTMMQRMDADSNGVVTCDV